MSIATALTQWTFKSKPLKRDVQIRTFNRPGRTVKKLVGTILYGEQNLSRPPLPVGKGLRYTCQKMVETNPNSFLMFHQACPMFKVQKISQIVNKLGARRNLIIMRLVLSVLTATFPLKLCYTS